VRCNLSIYRKKHEHVAVNGENVRFEGLHLLLSVLLLFGAFRQVESLDENIRFRFCLVS